MKKIFTIVAVTLLTASVFAQTPNKMSYQAVIRDNSNALVTNQIVGMQISILQGSANGTAVYAETQTPTTNTNGLVSLEIGGGTVVSGNFATINWANGPYFIKTETDPAGGTNYTITGTSQLLSVPFAMYAKRSGNPTLQAGNGISIVNDSIANIGDLSSTNELQTISTSNDTIFLSNGGFAKIPNLGKHILYLTDDISNAEAADKISSEVGINTQEIIITYCNNLTTVNLSQINKAIKIIIENNAVLSSVNLSGLTEVSSEFRISSNEQLNTLNLESLNKINGATTIKDNQILQSLNLSNLIRVTNMFVIQNNSSLTNVNLSNLTSATYLNFSNNSIQSLNLPQLINSSIYIFIDENQLESLNLPLISAGKITLKNSLINNLTLPSFNPVSLTNGADFIFTNNSLLTQVNLPLLQNLIGAFNFQNNPNLNLIQLPVISNIFPSANFNIGNCAFPQAQINYLLNKFANSTFSGTSQFYLSNQIPLAPPTGQGLIDKQILISNGHIVTTD